MYLYYYSVLLPMVVALLSGKAKTERNRQRKELLPGILSRKPLLGPKQAPH